DSSGPGRTGGAFSGDPADAHQQEQAADPGQNDREQQYLDPVDGDATDGSQAALAALQEVSRTQLQEEKRPGVGGRNDGPRAGFDEGAAGGTVKQRPPRGRLR